MRLAKYTKFRGEKFGGVLFETRSEKVFALNPTGAAIVREIGASCDESHLIERMQELFSDSGDSIEREVVAFLASLRERGLIED
jgi:hypothetical protein